MAGDPQGCGREQCRSNCRDAIVEPTPHGTTRKAGADSGHGRITAFSGRNDLVGRLADDVVTVPFVSDPFFWNESKTGITRRIVKRDHNLYSAIPF